MIVLRALVPPRDSLLQLAKEAFPGEGDSALSIFLKEGKTTARRYSLWQEDELIGAVTYEIIPLTAGYLIYLSIIAIFKKWQGQGLSKQLYCPLAFFRQITVAALTTQEPAVHHVFCEAVRRYGFNSVWPTGERVRVQEDIRALGRNILQVKGLDSSLDDYLVRRSYRYSPGRQNDALFGVGPRDGVLVIAVK